MLWTNILSEMARMWALTEAVVETSTCKAQDFFLLVMEMLGTKGHFDVAQGLLKTIHKLNELKKHYWLHV